MRSTALLCAAFLCLGLAACGDDTSTTANDSAAAAAPPADKAPPADVAPTAATAPAPVAAVESAPAAVESAPAAAAPAAGVAPPAEAPAPTAAAAPAASGDGPAYTVNCPPGATAAEKCQVDKDTYVGWRTFAGQCQVCHGGSGLGSTFAPNLLDRLNTRVDHARFVEVVTNGYTGQVGAMPAWKGNPNVMPHVDALYRYLKARADGALPPGRPERIPAS